MKLGRFAERDTESKLKEEEEATKAITVGARCEVTAPKASPRRGVVMFVGMQQVINCLCSYNVLISNSFLYKRKWG